MVNAGKIVPAPGITVHTDKHGVTREYREVKRKANVGELVKVAETGDPRVKNGEIYTVIESNKYGFFVDHPEGRNVKHGGANISPSTYVVLEPTDIVHHDGKRYRTIKRHAKSGEMILTVGDTSHAFHYAFNVNNGVATVGLSLTAYPDKYWVLELADQPSENVDERIDALEKRVAALELRLTTKHEYDELWEQTKQDFVKAWAPKTHYTRADVIELAKKDVEELLRTRNEDVRGIGWYDPKLDAVKFQVNRQKRTVVALISAKPSSGYGTHVWTRGIAKSAPDDCFNVHIGKAIALRRALGLDVPDYYVDAPKPDKMSVKPGDIIRYQNGNTFCMTSIGGCEIKYRLLSFTTGGWQPKNIGKEQFSSVPLAQHSFSIIDDSHDFGGEDQ